MLARPIEMRENLNAEIIVFIPVFNCQESVINVLNKIKADIFSRSILLIVDNGSSDNSVILVQNWIIQNKKSGIRAILIQTKTNLGYAGSQKLAYSLTCLYSQAKWVIMLHGDDQYDPKLLENFLKYANSSYGAIYGYRTKTKHWKKDETPFFTWGSIKLLNLIESSYTGVRLKEWHTGFIMYSTKFLKKISFDRLTNTPHLDGQLLSIAAIEDGALGIPIYKYYVGLVQFSGISRLKYIKSVFELMPKIKNMKKNHMYLSSEPHNSEKIINEFIVIEDALSSYENS